jgi:hypothetical protein
MREGGHHDSWMRATEAVNRIKHCTFDVTTLTQT